MPEKQYKRDILHSDFEQSMEMLRHYDSFHWDITKFCFGQICVIIGACWYIYEKIPEQKQSLMLFGHEIPIIGVLLILSSLFTLLCIISLLRNRTYFCRVSHYINEIREYSLRDNELQFDNESKMWTNRQHPPLKDGLSTQSLSIYLLSMCMVLSAAIGSSMLFSPDQQECAGISIGVATIIILIILYCCILKD